MTGNLIDTDAALAELCHALADKPWITLDTEFLRERTYYARLCLIQVAVPGIIACIDPLAGVKLDPLHALLEKPDLVKVLHAARQDLEVFHDLRGVVAAPLFDTQIAAAYLGYDDQIGYATLVAAITQVTLDKAHTRTDWSLRPLSAAQHRYAEDDVRYLIPVYEQLHERLHATGRLAWVMEDCARLCDPALYSNNPDEAWRRLRGGAELPAAGQQLLRALAVLRERLAQAHNLPRDWVVRDEVMFELARRPPTSRDALAAVRGLEDKDRARWGDAILECIEQASRAEPVPLWERLPPPTPEQTALAKRLMETVRGIAQEHGLAPALLATRRDIDKLVRGSTPDSVFRGWRATLLCDQLGALLPD